MLQNWRLSFLRVREITPYRVSRNIEVNVETSQDSKERQVAFLSPLYSYVSCRTKNRGIDWTWTGQELVREKLSQYWSKHPHPSIIACSACKPTPKVDSVTDCMRDSRFVFRKRVAQRGICPRVPRHVVEILPIPKLAPWCIVIVLVELQIIVPIHRPSALSRV